MESPRRNPAEPDRVLIVEDDAAQQRALIRLFGQDGITAAVASNGIQAFEALKDTDYAAIVCDLRMPDQSGFTFFEQLEERFPNMASRVVFVTAFADDPDAQDFLENTGQPVLGKPYDVHALIATVRQVLKRPF